MTEIDENLGQDPENLAKRQEIAEAARRKAEFIFGTPDLDGFAESIGRGEVVLNGPVEIRKGLEARVNGFVVARYSRRAEVYHGIYGGIRPFDVNRSPEDNKYVLYEFNGNDLPEATRFFSNPRPVPFKIRVRIFGDGEIRCYKYETIHRQYGEPEFQEEEIDLASSNKLSGYNARYLMSLFAVPTQSEQPVQPAQPAQSTQ